MTPTEDDELRRRVSAAYDDVLREPVPDRLKKLLDVPGPAPVVDLAAERARRARPAAAMTAKPAWRWAQWGGMAASLAVGVIAGLQFAGDRADGALLKDRGGHVVAGPTLAQALDTRLASDAPDRVAVQLSFLDRSGRYCRTFTADAVAGLACHDGQRWDVVTTAQAPAQSGAMRQAASSLPRPVLDAVDAQIAGSALGAAQERTARDRGWRR